MKKVTRADVAKDANVSPTIVSFVINNHRYVAADKKKRVLESMKKLGYYPDATARALKGKGSGQILLLVNNLHSTHYLELIDEIEKQAFSRGVVATLCRLRKDEDFLRSILSKNYEAVLMDGGTHSQSVGQALINSELPTIILISSNIDPYEGNYGLINTGLYEGTKEAILEMQKRGKKKIAYIHRYKMELDERDFRYKGYLDSIRNEPIIIHNHQDEKELEEKVLSSYKENHFDAIFCRDDNLAMIAIHTLLRNGIKVPEDVSVVGVDATKMGKRIYPSLASIKIDREAIVTKFFEQVEQLKKNEKPEPIKLKATLVEGDSLN